MHEDNASKCLKKLRAGKALIIPDISTSDEITFYNNILLENRIKSVLMIPFQYSGNRLGAIGFFSEQNKEWRSHEINILKLFSEHFALAFKHNYIQEERKRLAIAVEQAAEAIIRTDNTAKIQYVNPAFEHTTGYSKEEVIGQTPRIINSDKHPKSFYKKMLQILLAGKGWKGHL